MDQIRASLVILTRKELQSRCKQARIRANGKSAEMIEELAKHIDLQAKKGNNRELRLSIIVVSIYHSTLRSLNQASQLHFNP